MNLTVSLLIQVVIMLSGLLTKGKGLRSYAPWIIAGLLLVALVYSFVFWLCYCRDEVKDAEDEGELKFNEMVSR